jgi:hypothetical protein
MKRLLQIAGLALAVCTAKAQGTYQEAITDFSGASSTSYPGTIGWTFQTTANIELVSLGCFNYLFPDYGAISVGFWKGDGTLLASNTVTSSTAPSGLARYESIAPISLVSGQTYYIGAYYPGGLNLQVASFASSATVTSATEIQAGLIVKTASGFGFPGVAEGPGAALGPTFQFSRNVPEPSAVALLCLGGLGLAAWRVRRR